TEYCLKHDSIGPVETFHFTEYDDFRNFVKNAGFVFRSSAEQELDELLETCDKLGLSADTRKRIDELRKSITNETNAHLDKYRKEIIDQIEMDIAGRYYFEKGKTRQRLKRDNELQKAIEILNDPKAYQALLK